MSATSAAFAEGSSGRWSSRQVPGGEAETAADGRNDRHPADHSREHGGGWRSFACRWGCRATITLKYPNAINVRGITVVVVRKIADQSWASSDFLLLGQRVPRAGSSHRASDRPGPSTSIDRIASARSGRTRRAIEARAAADPVSALRQRIERRLGPKGELDSISKAMTRASTDPERGADVGSSHRLLRRHVVRRPDQLARPSSAARRRAPSLRDPEVGQAAARPMPHRSGCCRA